HDVAYSPDKTRLATASEDGTAKIWNVATGQELMTLHQADAAPHMTGEATPQTSVSHEVYAVAFNADGTRLATGSRDGTAVVWNAATGIALLTFQASDPALNVTAVAFSPDGAQLAMVGVKLFDTTQLVWEVKAWKLATREVTFSNSSGSSSKIF